MYVCVCVRVCVCACVCVRVCVRACVCGIFNLKPCFLILLFPFVAVNSALVADYNLAEGQ